MVVLFKGTDKSKNYSPQAVALCAGISATKFYKKTLIVQLTTKYPIEDYLIGKKINEQNINNNTYLFEDSGLDSLIRRVGVASFRQEHFSNAVTPVVSSENLLDVLNVSKQTEEDLIRELTKTPTIIGTIIKAAIKIYDNVFIITDGKDTELIKGIIPYMDKTVTCVPQSIKEEITACASEDHCYLVTSYDYKSSYGIRQMTKIYGGRTFIMPYNVDFKDYYTSNNMLQYILHNNNPEPGDYSFHLIDEMTKFVKYITENEEAEDNTYKFSYRTLERILDPETPFAGVNVEITQEYGRFGKIRNVVHYDADKNPISEEEYERNRYERDISDDEEIEMEIEEAEETEETEEIVKSKKKKSLFNSKKKLKKVRREDLEVNTAPEPVEDGQELDGDFEEIDVTDL